MTAETDLFCVSHLRWDFVFQRPQHLLSRAAKERRVYYMEEPTFDTGNTHPCLETHVDSSGVNIVVPHMPTGLTEDQTHASLRALVDGFFEEQGIKDVILWMYTPMLLPVFRHLEPRAVVYDCMDELSNFRFAPPELRARERELFAWADVVFTGGYSLWEAKRLQHPNAHPFPSSVDVAHFATARGDLDEPEDMQGIPHPRIGFYGVVDERMDFDLLKTMAEARPDWQIVILGPVVKVAPEDLPRSNNIHYLGGRKYEQLPAYLAHWDVAMLPFARNESTEFISPTKTPEYLAAGKPVVSTAIRDVVRPYGDRDLVLIGNTHEEFIAAVEEALRDPKARQATADGFVGRMSWDRTWRQMKAVISETMVGRLPGRSGRASPLAGRAGRVTSGKAVNPLNSETEPSGIES